MKRNLFKLTGVLAIMLILVFGLAGCDNGTSSDPGNTDPKTIVITGITETGSATIHVSPNMSNDTAIGTGTVSSNTVTFPLKVGGSDWNGNGSYYLKIDVSSKVFIYTNGATLDVQNLPKYSITEATSTIAFDKFKQYTQ